MFVFHKNNGESWKLKVENITLNACSRLHTLSPLSKFQCTQWHKNCTSKNNITCRRLEGRSAPSSLKITTKVLQYGSLSSAFLYQSNIINSILRCPSWSFWHARSCVCILWKITDKTTNPQDKAEWPYNGINSWQAMHAVLLLIFRHHYINSYPHIYLTTVLRNTGTMWTVIVRFISPLLTSNN